MAHPLRSTQPLLQQLRAHGHALLAGAPDPHAELMALVWGPRFDRTHGLELVLRQAPSSARTLPAVLAAADHFDTLPGAVQQRLRHLILRHRALRLPPRILAHGAADEVRISPHAPCSAD